jgi:hypothetical protein
MVKLTWPALTFSIDCCVCFRRLSFSTACADEDGVDTIFARAATGHRTGIYAVWD